MKHFNWLSLLEFVLGFIKNQSQRVPAITREQPKFNGLVKANTLKNADCRNKLRWRKIKNCIKNGRNAGKVKGKDWERKQGIGTLRVAAFLFFFFKLVVFFFLFLTVAIES